jgi:hypothetical protein
MKNRYYSLIFCHQIYSSFEWLSVFYISYTITLNSSNSFSPLFAGLVFLTPSISRIFFSKVFGRISSRLEKETKYRNSVYLRILILLLGSILYFWLNNQWVSIAFVFLYQTILILDSYFLFNLKYDIVDNSEINLTQYVSFSNTTKRGSLILVSILSFSSIGDNNLGLFILTSAYSICGIVASIYTLKEFCGKSKRPGSNQGKLDENQETSSHPKINLAFFVYILVTLNLIFGSLPYIYTHIISSHGLMFFELVSIITVFYGSFLTSNIVIALLSAYIEKNNNHSIVFITCIVNSFAGIMYFVFQDSTFMIYIATTIMGSTYAIITSVSSRNIFLDIKGKNQEIFFSRWDTAMKSAFICSISISSFAVYIEMNLFFIISLYALIHIPIIFAIVKLTGVYNDFSRSKIRIST